LKILLPKILTLDFREKFMHQKNIVGAKSNDKKVKLKYWMVCRNEMLIIGVKRKIFKLILE
jgi:hypothetical protein